MQLYLLRHAEAHPREARDCPPDFERELTDRGRRQAACVGKALRRMGIEFDAVLSSPAPRALDTARLALRELGHEERIQILDALWSGDEETIFEACGRIRGERICLTGHEPTLGLLAGLLSTGMGGISMPLKKAGLVRIDLDRMPPVRRGVLRWMLTGKQISLIAGKSGKD